MAFIPVPEVTEAILQGRVDGQLCINTLYFTGAADTSAGAQEVADAIAGWATAHLLLHQCSAFTLENVIANNLTTANSSTATHAVNVVGTETGEPVPNNVAACVSFRSGLRGRSFRGRNYVASIPNGEVDVNLISSAWVANLISDYENLLPGGALDGTGLTWVLVSRFSGVDSVTHKPIPRTTGIFTLAQNVKMTTPYVRSMRTREVGKGA